MRIGQPTKEVDDNTMNATDNRIDEIAVAATLGLDAQPAQALEEGLAASPLLAGLPAEEAADVIAAFDAQTFNLGHRVTLEGYRGREFYVIVSGRAAVTVGGRRVAELGPGDFFGEVAVLREGLRSATVTAETPLRTLVLSDGALMQLLEAHPRLGINMLREVLARFTDTPAPARPAHAVLDG